MLILLWNGDTEMRKLGYGRNVQVNARNVPTEQINALSAQMD